MIGIVLFILTVSPFLFLYCGNLFFEPGWLLKVPILYNIVVFQTENLVFFIIVSFIESILIFGEFKTGFYRKEIHLVFGFIRWFYCTSLSCINQFFSHSIKNKYTSIFVLGILLIAFGVILMSLKLTSTVSLHVDLWLLFSDQYRNVGSKEEKIDIKIDQSIIPSGILETKAHFQIRGIENGFGQLPIGLAILKPLKPQGYSFDFELKLRGVCSGTDCYYPGIGVDTDGREVLKNNRSHSNESNWYGVKYDSKFCVCKETASGIEYEICLMHEFRQESMRQAVDMIKEEMILNGISDYSYECRIETSVLSPNYLSFKQKHLRGEINFSYLTRASVVRSKWFPIKKCWGGGSFERRALREFLSDIPGLSIDNNNILKWDRIVHLNKQAELYYKVQTPWRLDPINILSNKSLNHYFDFGLQNYGHGHQYLQASALFNNIPHQWLEQLVIPLGLVFLGIGLAGMIGKISAQKKR